jgi:cell pole-organizing protein PopZ
MTQAAKAQEPSMEEILASIRRIIADDDAAKAPPPLPPEPPMPPPVAAAPVRPVPPPPPPARPPREPSVNETVLDEMLAELNATPAPVDTAEEMASDVLDLTEAMAEPSPPSGFRTIDGQSDIVFEDSPTEQAAEPVDNGARLLFPERPHRPLMSSATSAAVDSAFNTLAHTVLVQNARTLEDLVKEMLQPLLKSWLDDNLPGLVERLVRAEIERVSRGRG